MLIFVLLLSQGLRTKEAENIIVFLYEAKTPNLYWWLWLFQ